MSELSEGECESDVVRQFRALAKVGDDASTFGIERGAVLVKVRYSGGSGSFLELSAPYPRRPRESAPDGSAQGGGYRSPAAESVVRAVRPLGVTLRAEGDDDRHAKESSVAREFQTGDPVFDDAVYVDTPSSDEALAVLLKPREVRDGVRALLAEGARSVVIDGDNEARVVMTLHTFASAAHDADRAQRMLDAFVAVAAHVPYIAPSGGAHETPARVTLLYTAAFFAFALLVLGIPIFFALAPARCVVSTGDGQSFTCTARGCCDGPVLGLVGGLVAGFLASIAVASRFKGRSDSHHHRTIAYVVTVFLVTVASMFGASLASWHR